MTDKARCAWSVEMSANDFVYTMLQPALLDAEILCRAAVDHQGTPLTQFPPPLVFSRVDIDTLVGRVRRVATVGTSTGRCIDKTESKCRFFAIYLCYPTSNTEVIAVTRRSRTTLESRCP